MEIFAPPAPCESIQGLFSDDAPEKLAAPPKGFQNTMKDGGPRAADQLTRHFIETIPFADI